MYLPFLFQCVFLCLMINFQAITHQEMVVETDLVIVDIYNDIKSTTVHMMLTISAVDVGLFSITLYLGTT